MSARTIYSKLRAAGLSPAGACGLLGNLMAESGMTANIAQRGMTELTDAQYTAKFDASPELCYRDGVGYGLAQWTFWSRKQELSRFAKARGTSVGSENTQVEFILHELHSDFGKLWDFLCTTDDLYAAADRVCREFERPAVNNVDRRYEFAKVFYDEFNAAVSAPKEDKWFPPDLSILILQAVLVGNAYNTEITGYKNEHFLKTLRQFVSDIGG